VTFIISLKESLKGYNQQQQCIFIPEEYYHYSALSWDESTIWNSNKIFFLNSSNRK